MVLVAAVLGDDVDHHARGLPELGGGAVGVDLDGLDGVELDVGPEGLGGRVARGDAVDVVVVAVGTLAAHRGVARPRLAADGVDAPVDAGQHAHRGLVGPAHGQVLQGVVGHLGGDGRLAGVDDRFFGLDDHDLLDLGLGQGRGHADRPVQADRDHHAHRTVVGGLDHHRQPQGIMRQCVTVMHRLPGQTRAQAAAIAFDDADAADHVVNELVATAERLGCDR